MADYQQARNPKAPSVTTPELSLPQGGKTNGYGETFQPILHTGTATLSMPIHLTVGRTEPDPLMLTYSSGSGNGPFGQGITISIPFISLRTEKGIPLYSGKDTYILSTGEQLVPRYDHDGSRWKLASRVESLEGVNYSVVAYRPRVETSFSKIEQWINTQTQESFWQITDRNNNISVFGQKAEARIFDPANPTHTFQWLLESTIDPHGNKTQYIYKPENEQNIPNQVFSEGHLNTANKYIERILYGNFTDAEGKEIFAFEVIFDYGEYDLDLPTLHPVRPWLCRDDIFSSFRSGFEVRTYRLCQNILMVHHLPNGDGSDDYLVNVTRLKYHSSGITSLLKSFQRIGYRLESDGSYWTQELPPLELEYTQWEPQQQSFNTLSVYGGGSLPGVFDQTTLQMVDLYGEGLPGVLYTAAGSMLYWRPRGEGAYDPSVSVPVYPSEDDLADRRYALMDIDGTGSLDLIVGEDGRGGFYPNRGGKWEQYRSFQTYTAEFSDNATEFIDINGDGIADLYVPNGRYLRYYLSHRALGFGAPVEQLKSSGFPSASLQSEETLITFTDIFGDGLAHRILVGDGRVEVWPNLGYGRFGPKIIMGNAPEFGPSLRTSRILLADVNGSGRSSLIFVYDDHIDVFINQSGNYFEDAIRINLPFEFSDVDQVMTADVLGTGLASLVFTKVSGDVRHLFLDLCGSERPYLLKSIRNNLGGHMSVTYKSSTAYYLADRSSEEPWVTRLTFPVDVVAKVEARDELLGSNIVKVYQYSDGYYDPVEREFRGFGFVQAQDTESFAPDVWHFPTTTEPPDNLVAPALTKTWIHTGAYVLNDVISKQFEKEYYKGDAQALTLPDSIFSPDIFEAGPETLREAYCALQAQEIRSEIYGLQDDGNIKANPYTISELNYRVELLQPRIDGHYAVFHVSMRENATSHYECEPDNPRINHEFNLVLDDYGNTKRAASVYYPPRIDRDIPGQQLSVAAVETEYINETDGFYLVGLAYKNSEYELGGLSTGQNLYFTFDQLADLVEEALSKVIDYGAPFTPGEIEARPYEMWQSYFWNASQTGPLPLGQTSAQMLLHNVETAAFPQSLVNTLFGSKVTEEMLRDELKYVLKEGYWWNPGMIERFFDASAFFLPSEVVDAFGNRTSLGYDEYLMRQTLLEDALQQTVLAQPDYQAMQTRLILDVNKNTSEVLFDPLGEVFVMSIYKMKDGNPVAGNMNLADYRIIRDPTTQQVLDDPARFLQGASLYYYYDLTSCLKEPKQPVHSILLERHKYVYGPDSEAALVAAEDEISVTIDYVDGLMRPLCKKVKLEASATPVGGPGFLYINKEQVVYNEKSEPVKRYLPYFTPGPDFDPYANSPFFTIFYDALERPTLTLTPRGFYTRNEYRSWALVYFDEDDTVKTSPYYQENINNHDPSFANELNALEKAALFNDTPTIWDINGPGFTVRETRNNVIGEGTIIERSALHSAFWLDIVGNRLKIVDPRFYNEEDPNHPSQYNFVHVFDMTSKPLSTWGADSGTRLSLSDVRGRLIYAWNSAGYKTIMAYDALSRLISTYVEGNGLDQFTDLIAYGSDPDHNNCDQMIQQNDTAGIAYYTDYDIQGNLTQMSRKLLKEYEGTVNWNDPAVVRLMDDTWTISRLYDSSNILTQEISADGSVYTQRVFLNGWTREVSIKFPEAESERVIASLLTYGPGGQRLTVSYSNPAAPAPGYSIASRYSYDAKDNRLQSIQTVRISDQFKLQDLHYTYDPVGNITRIEDHAQIVSGAPAEGYIYDYTYDAVYQLKIATGRQQTGTAPNICNCSLPPGLGSSQPDSAPAYTLSIENYREQYDYDFSGNLTLLRHQSPSPDQNWSTEMVVSPTSNHAMPKDVLNGGNLDQFFDASGNQNGLVTPQALAWDFGSRLISATVTKQSPGAVDNSYFLYNARGGRMREVVERITDNRLSERTDTIYIGNLVVARTSILAPDSAAQEEIEVRSLRVLLNGQCALVTSITGPPRQDGSASDERTYRYQLDNSLSSVVVEVDQSGQIVTYEEYFPYGCTSVLFGSGDAAIAQKRYRYNGKELDRSTGLYYYGARYYGPWQFRWLSPDPAGIIDGLNLYAYVGGNPITFKDEEGYCKDDPKYAKKQQYYKQKLIQKTAFVFSETFFLTSLLAGGLALFPGAPKTLARSMFRASVYTGINRRNLFYRSIFGSLINLSRYVNRPGIQTIARAISPALEFAPVIGGLQFYILYKSLYPFPKDVLGLSAATMATTAAASGLISVYEMYEIYFPKHGAHGAHGSHGASFLTRVSKGLFTANIISMGVFFSIASYRYLHYRGLAIERERLSIEPPGSKSTTQAPKKKTEDKY